MHDPVTEKSGPGSLLAPLSGQSARERLSRLSELKKRYMAGEAPLPESTSYVNNHIHTIYSFSPYSPSDAVYRSWLSGLATTGIMDHDSVSGADEFIEAGKLLGIATTAGFECRCRMTGTPYAGRTLNNPDQSGIAYVACHGIPHQFIDRANQWLAPYREKRLDRDIRMTERLNSLHRDPGLTIDFKKEVLPASQNKDGGSVTERHLLFVLAQKAAAACGRGEPLLQLLEERFQIHANGKVRDALLDKEDPYYDYRLLGLLKSSLVEKFYIDADEECPHILDFVAFVKSIGAIPAYAYLGDVTESVTGDKKNQTFEDSFLDELIPWLKDAGFTAVTYMPTRNNMQQLARVMELCERYDLFQISGEDINTPFQPFICKHLLKNEFSHLITSAWALIGHEIAATNDPEMGMFTESSIKKYPALSERIAYFASAGKNAKG